MITEPRAASLEQSGSKPNGRVRIVPTIEGELLLKFIDEDAGTSSRLNEKPYVAAIGEITRKNDAGFTAH